LNPDRILRGKELLAAVQVGPKDDPFLGDATERAQAEDLETTAVRQNGAVPIHESMKPSNAGDHLFARPEIEVVSITK
jgi:hypothetical protein